MDTHVWGNFGGCPVRLLFFFYNGERGFLASAWLGKFLLEGFVIGLARQLGIVAIHSIRFLAPVMTPSPSADKNETSSPCAGATASTFIFASVWMLPPLQAFTSFAMSKL